MPVDFEILIKDGKAMLLSVSPWAPDKKVEPEIISISKNGELVTGRRNSGSGVAVTIAKLDSKGNTVGEEWLKGFIMQDDFPAEAREQMMFILTNPNILKASRQ